MKNFFDTNGNISSTEIFENVIVGDNLRVERIISHGQTTPPGEWYNQEQDEWVLVLQGEARIAYMDGSDITLCKGEHLFLPRHKKHRISYTSTPCLWLAVFADKLQFDPDGKFVRV